MMFPYALTTAATVLLLLSYPIDAFRPRRNRHIRRCSHNNGKLLFHLRCGHSDDIIDKKDNAEEEDGETKSRKMYNKQASNWVRTEPSCLSDFTGRPVVFSMLEDVLKGSDDKVVLDVGCGEGYCARKVVEMGAAKVVGSDISKEMITCALDVSNGDDRFKYYEAAAGNLLGGLNDNRGYLEIDSAEEAFDVVIAVFLFNYLTTNEMEGVIRQIYTTLKPGGTFVFSVPHPSMIFCHHKGAIFRLNSENKGYYSSRNEKITGTISKIDGTTLNIMSVHKTLADYMKAIFSAGFEIVDIQEAGVTEEHMKLHPEFFQSVKDRPLHLVFKLQKPN